ncbi:hypothetical protein E0Z10_g4302 [Xylaria hypoxylon]|uniref:Uncharacterized protein n=1 Tax=Xylaria hypoxylon TaxID=37992 RepID=A0A4Z0Z102_9PEZI|nr:hypothetical protein E0Z10_g4302 [Xylaria hypoxylon]
MTTQRIHGPEASVEDSITSIDNQGDILSSQQNHDPESFVEGSVTSIDNEGEILGNQESHPLSEENSNAFSVAEEPPTDQRLSLKQSLGYGGLFGVIGGSLWVLGIFGFLTFLWFGHGSAPEAANATSLWRFIALHNYFPQTITICSVALRVAVGIQATICTSMIASLILEKHGAQKRDVAWLSIMRSLNGGPHKLGSLLLSKRSLTDLLRIETWLTFLVIVVTLALQFSSTLLLSDINKFVILGDLNNTEFGDTFLYKEGDFAATAIELEFITQPPVYAAFGEVQAGFDATPNESGLSDTGLIQRSLLPIPETDARVSVRKAEGTTIVMSSHSSCIRPRMSAKYGIDFYTFGDKAVVGRIVGAVDYNASFQDAGVPSNSLCSDAGCETVGFSCTIPTRDYNNTDWQTISCLFGGVLGAVNPSKNYPVWNPADGPWSLNSSVVLVITTNMGNEDWMGVPSDTLLPVGSPYQEWQSYDTGLGHFNITLCSTGFSLGRFHTSMVAPRFVQEPQNKFVRTSSTHNTTDVRALMGVKIPQGNHMDRNILDLEILGAPEDPPGSSQASELLEFELFGNVTMAKLTLVLMEFIIYLQSSPGFFANQSMTLCYFCSANGYAVNPEISLLFSDTVAETGRAANALLSLMTTIFASVYYAYLDTLQVPHAARVVTTTIVETPGPCSTNGCPGYVTVSTLILLHVICVVTTAALYVTQIRYSRYGNVWHTVAQLRGDDLTVVLTEGHDASDSVIERSLKLKYENQPLKVGRQRTTGRVEVISG